MNISLVDNGPTRRGFLKTSAGSVLVASLIPILNLRGRGVVAQQLRPSVVPATKLVPPAHGKIPVPFIIGRGAETIDFVGPWEVFQFALRPSQAGGMGASMDDMQA